MPPSEVSADAGRPHGIVLVHGGESGAWCWDRVVERLRWPAVAVDLPGRGPGDNPGALELADFTRGLVAAVRATGFHRVLLVAHSMGGLSVLSASPALEDVIAQRVFISSLIPRTGTRGVDALSLPFRWLLVARLRPAARSQRPVLLLPRWLARRKFCRDLASEDAALVLERRCPEPAGIPLTVLQHGPLANAPDVFVVLRDDRAMSARRQRRMATHLANATVFELDGGHMTMLSDPARLASALDDVADAVFAPKT